MKRPLAFFGCIVSVVLLFAGLGYAQQIATFGVVRVVLFIGGSLILGLVCAIVYYNEKNNEHSYVDPKIDIETLAHYEEDKK